MLLETIFGATTVAVGDDALLDALCETETALARACVRAELVALPDALEIGAVCEQLRHMDITELARRSVAGGNPVIPLVAELRERVRARSGDTAAAAVHLGATSQDILDTAMMLISSRALGVITANLAACADTAADLAREHRDTPMAARTLLQLAQPTTFGALVATWGRALDRARGRLDALRDELPVQLGGAAGTLAALAPHGELVRAALADELGLADPGTVWHADRTVITELAGALGTSCASVAKIAVDLVLLAQNELGEVRERAPGGSSAMAHKQNPIAAITARAAALQAPGLVATLLSAAAPELQRGAGPWHAEWPALLALLQFSSGAAARLHTALDIEVDTAAMRRNLDLLDGDSPDVGDAPALVDDFLHRHEGRLG